MKHVQSHQLDTDDQQPTKCLERPPAALRSTMALRLGSDTLSTVVKVGKQDGGPEEVPAEQAMMFSARIIKEAIEKITGKAYHPWNSSS